MAVTAADLVAPAGELETNLFPGESLAAGGGRLDEYIAEATALIAALPSPPDDADQATKAWAYHKAYRAVYIRMSADPQRASLDDQGSEQFDIRQADRFLALSREWRKNWDRMVSTETEAEGPTLGGGTGAVSTEFFW